MSSSVLPMFFSKSFIVFGLTFRFLIHFEFIFVYGVRKCSNFILLHVAFQFSQHNLLKSIPVSQRTDKLVWDSRLFKNFPQFVVIHTVKGFKHNQ